MFPSTTKRPKASTTEPADPCPSPPCNKMRRVVATLRLSRSSVAMRTKAGKALNSSASSMNSAVRKTPMARAIDTDRRTSRSIAGTGSTIIRMMPMIPSGTMTSALVPFLSVLTPSCYARAVPSAGGAYGPPVSSWRALIL